MEPRKISGLMALDADELLETRPDLAVYLKKMRDSFLKKLETVDHALEVAAFDTFSIYNRRGFEFKVEPKSLWETQVLDTVRYRFSQLEQDLFCAPCPLIHLAGFGDFGTGASAGTEQDYVKKVLSAPITFSHGDLIVPYKKYCEHSGWSSPEKERQLNYGMQKVPFGAATFVPKDSTKYRMVVTQPSLDMFFQRGFGEFIRSKLKSYFHIDLSSQELQNKELALLGSVSGLFATIDSTSASDSIYLEPLIECGVISPFMESLIRTFRPECITYGRKTIKLSMIGTQGSGYTFDLMTFLLCSIVEGVYGTVGIPMKSRGKDRTFGVYGDDVVCVNSAFHLVIRAMEMFGFVPNVEKSYSTGSFRESCGGDYDRGVNVRPYYPRRLNSKQALCVVYNRLIEECCVKGIFFWRTLKALRRELKDMPEVPLHSGYDSGRHSLISGDYFFYQALPGSYKVRTLNPTGRVQCTLRGNISCGTRVLCRRDGRSDKYVLSRGFAYFKSSDAPWLRGLSTQEWNRRYYHFIRIISYLR